MIQDCGSFTAEYTATYKPMLFLIANQEVVADWNECGKAILEHIYTSKKGEKIEEFISKIVIEENDFMKEDRISFVNEYLRPIGNDGASNFVFKYLKKEFDLD